MINDWKQDRGELRIDAIRRLAEYGERLISVLHRAPLFRRRRCKIYRPRQDGEDPPGDGLNRADNSRACRVVVGGVNA